MKTRIILIFLIFPFLLRAQWEEIRTFDLHISPDVSAPMPMTEYKYSEDTNGFDTLTLRVNYSSEFINDHGNGVSFIIAPYGTIANPLTYDNSYSDPYLYGYLSTYEINFGLARSNSNISDSSYNVPTCEPLGGNDWIFDSDMSYGGSWENFELKIEKTDEGYYQALLTVNDESVGSMFIYCYNEEFDPYFGALFYDDGESYKTYKMNPNSDISISLTNSQVPEPEVYGISFGILALLLITRRRNCDKMQPFCNQNS